LSPLNPYNYDTLYTFQTPDIEPKVGFFVLSLSVLILLSATKGIAQKEDRLAGLSSPVPDNKHYAVKVYAYILCDGSGGGCPSVSVVRPYLDDAFAFFDEHRIHPYLSCVDVIANNDYYLDPEAIASDPAYQHSDGMTLVLTNSSISSKSGYTPYTVPHFVWSIHNNSRVIAHELGHRFGLEHTFESTTGWCQSGWYGSLAELADGSECHLRGDYTCDTPPEADGGIVQVSNCVGVLSSCLDPLENPYTTPVPVNNIMSATAVSGCPFFFTEGQGLRMRTALHSLGTLPNYTQSARIIRKDTENFYQFYSNTTLTGSVFCYHDILINSGVTVTISGTVKMAKGKRIRLATGAKLVVNGQVTSLGGDICADAEGGMWYGIRLPSVPTSSSLLYGSECVLNNAKISNAQRAIEAVSSPGAIKGARVEATNTLFLNNANSVYSWANNAPNLSAGGLLFTNCTFDVDEDFIADHPFSSHATLVGGIHTDFLACEFKQSMVPKEDLTKNQLALYVHSTNVTVDQAQVPCPPNTPCSIGGTYTKFSRIENFGRGIFCGNIGGMKALTVRNTFLDDCTIYGIETSNILMAELVNNRLIMRANDAQGFNLRQTGSYTISNNEFQAEAGAQGATIGISVWYGGAMNNQIFNNKYTGLYHANYAEGTNGGSSTGLEYLCNQNYGSLQNDFNVRNNSPTPLRQQQGSQEIPAGNIFSNPANAQGHFFLQESIPAKIQYHALDLFGEVPTKIDEDKVEVKKTTSSNSTCGEDFGPQETPWPGQEFTTNENEYWQYRGTYDSLSAVLHGQLDGGSTASLVDWIANADATDTSAILAQLSADRPWVSAEALAALFQRNDLFSSGQITQVCSQNPDALVDASILQILHSGNSGLDSTQLAAISAASGTTTVRRNLTSAMHEARISADRRVYHLIRHLSMSPGGTDYSRIRSWLARLNYLETDLATIWTYMAEGDWTGAKAVCQAASVITTQPAAYEWAEMDAFVTLMDQGLADPYDLTSLDSVSVAVLHNFATEEKDPNRAATMATSILNTYYGFQLPYSSYQPSPSQAVARQRQHENNVQVQELVVHPNPAQGILSVVLNDSEPCLLRIVDQRGRLSLALQTYRSHEVVDISRLAPGLYIVQAIFSHGDIHAGKVVIR